LRYRTNMMHYRYSVLFGRWRIPLPPSFESMRRHPPVVLIMTLGYWEGSDRDEVSPEFARMCCDWRELFASYPSLWTRLDVRRVDKTRVYIGRCMFPNPSADTRARPFKLQVLVERFSRSPHSLKRWSYTARPSQSGQLGEFNASSAGIKFDRIRRIRLNSRLSYHHVHLFRPRQTLSRS